MSPAEEELQSIKNQIMQEESWERYERELEYGD